MFNFTQFLKSYKSAFHWNIRIKNYITKYNKLMEFEKTSNNYNCNVETAIDFMEKIDLDQELKQKILIVLLKRRVLELKNEVVAVVPAPVKVSSSLESEHFNIYGVNNINELAQNIIEDIKKVELDEVKNIFKDYVYFFTYFYKYNSIRTHVASIRKAIRESDLTPEQKEVAIQEFKFSDRVHDWLNEGGQRTRTKNMQEVLEPLEVTAVYDFVNDSKKYFDMKVPKSEFKKAFTHLVVAVSLSIGRRLTEIVTQSTVEKFDKYKVIITGLGKKRNDEVVKIIVPTLFLTADEVIVAIKKIHSLIPKGLRTKEQRDKFAHNLTDFNLVNTQLWTENSKFDSTRAIYAIVSELIYNQNNIKEENRKPQATYIQGLLGHEASDFTTYQHYYKRQILIKDFDLKSYLTFSKTAML
jgi:hypothetical protein